MKYLGPLLGAAAFIVGCGGNSDDGSPALGAGGAGNGAPGADAAASHPSGPEDSALEGCKGQTLPPIDDYGAMGPYPTTTILNTGPDGNYTVVRPVTLGENGFKHPPLMWGNGITTTPAAYTGLLGTIASNGFVVVASNSTTVTTALMNAGLDWLVAQNDAPGDYQGKLNPTCLVSVGYSLGGGAAVGAGSHENVVTTVSFHGLTGNSAALHGPLLLFTSLQDTFVSAAQFVDPTFKASAVQTFYATLSGDGDSGHLTPINTAGPERAPAVAWLRLWVYGDQAARKYFDGPDCTLCKDPWSNPQTKNWP
jgi:hypothetical protein